MVDKKTTTFDDVYFFTFSVFTVNLRNSKNYLSVWSYVSATLVEYN